VIWEGLVEDISMSLLDETTTVQCFGLQRLLDLTSVRRIWSKRDIDFQLAPGGFGTSSPFNVLNSIPLADINVAIGRYNPADASAFGIRITGNGAVVAANAGHGATVYLPGFKIKTVRWQTGRQGIFGVAANFNERLLTWNQGSTSILDAYDFTGFATPSEQGVALLNDCDSIGFYCWNSSGGNQTPTWADIVDFTAIRILATAHDEDVLGGFYGGTILRDLVSLVPGLTVGLIEDGSDYTIQSIERSARDSARSVVGEVASYYSREWRVWEDGRFDWQSVNADEPQWITTLDDLDSGSEITSTIDGLAKTVYVLYADAASGLDNEASATASEQRNPFVKQGKTSDVLISPGFPMTSSSASQLAARLITDQGRYPLVQGKLVLPAMTMIRRASGSPLPAFMIRAGQNVVVSDLPKTDLFSQGRDGETLFHIVSTEADLASGNVTLEVEGQTRRSDVLLARLAAATRRLTG
jgi:hypothetical protein